MKTKRRQGKRSGPLPSWYDPKNYDGLNPARSPNAWAAWKSALNRRYSKLLALDKLRDAEAGRDPKSIFAKPGDTIRADPNRIPPWLVLPWGDVPAPPGLEPSMLFTLRTDGVSLGRGDHMATRAQPGFAMWFNMDASDDVIRSGFERVLKMARERWPSRIKQRGRGSASPRITEAILGVWWRRKIIPLFDLDWYFAGGLEARPTDTLLGRWLYGDEVQQPAREVNKARTLMREAIAQRAALHHSMKFPGLSPPKTGM